MLIVDDIIGLPGKIGGIILNTIMQTANKSIWRNYLQQLNQSLYVARHDLEQGKLTKKEFKEIEERIFKEMRTARRVIGSGK